MGTKKGAPQMGHRKKLLGLVVLVGVCLVLAREAQRLAAQEGVPPNAVVPTVGEANASACLPPGYYWIDCAAEAKPLEEIPVIAVGTVLSDAAGEEAVVGAPGMFPVPGRWHTVTLRLERSITGLPRGVDEIHIKVFIAEGPPAIKERSGGYELAAGTTYLLFLRPDRERGANIFRFDPRGPAPLTVRSHLLVGGERSVSANGSIPDAIASIAIETARVDDPALASSAVALLGFLSGWYDNAGARRELDRLLATRRPEVVALAVRGLSSGPHRQASYLPRFSKMTSSRNAAISGAAIAARIRLADTSALVSAADWPKNGQRAPTGQVCDIAWAISSGKHTVADKAGVKGLTSIMGSKIVEFRRQASDVLREIATKDMTAALIGMLDDSDTLVQWHVVLALYRAAEGPWNKAVKGLAPGLDAFQREPKRYVSQWKQWWTDGAPIQYAESFQRGKHVSGSPPAAESVPSGPGGGFPRKD